ncbi:AAA family ATPase [Chloroflexota bacterium]
MFISKIKLKNIRCFEDIEIDFMSSEGNENWTLILGNNGVGKTTLLRSIAMSV